MTTNKARCSIMTHLPSEVQYAIINFNEYLTAEELQNRQTTGRYWYIGYNNGGFQISERPSLFIIIDNDSVLCVHYDEDDELVECVYDRANPLVYIPDSFRGMYYDN